MDNSVMRGGLLQGSTAGILDLDSTIHLHQPSMTPLSLNHHHQHQQSNHLHPAMALSSDHPMYLFSPPPSMPAATFQYQRGKLASSPVSDEDDDPDPGIANEDDVGGVRGKKGGSSSSSSSSSPWHRMKWTDEMVRLLISSVACVGDDGAAEMCDDGPVGAKRKSGGGALQKKGKWKTVSKMMLEKGCYVSPQQCEDKFNDLNKRYKRLNDIFGRGTTCQVVENPSLLDSMNVSSKAKDVARKILSSKHLFYREMCAYHNGPRIPSSCEAELTAGRPATVPKDADGIKIEEEEDEEEVDGEEKMGTEGAKNIESEKAGHESLQLEIAGVLLQDTQRDWLMKRGVQFEEEMVEIQTGALELEKRRFKWQRFCSSKDRELERMRLDNERMALENERMLMEVSQKELELEAKKSEESGMGGGRR